MRNYFDWVKPESYPFCENFTQILALEGDEIFCGPEGDPEAVFEDQIFAKNFSYLLSDLAQSYGFSFKTDGTLPQAVGCPFREYINNISRDMLPILTDGYDDFSKIIHLPENDEFGTIYGAFVRSANEDWTLRGLILGSDIAVDPTYQNLGLGSGLVAAQLISDGHLNVWNHDTPGYSTQGKAAVRRGLSIAENLYDLNLGADFSF